MKRTRSLDSISSRGAPQPTFVLLEIPVSSANLLPPKVNVTWTVTPYRLSAHLTPRLPLTGGPSCFAASNSCLLLTAPRPLPSPPIIPPPVPPSFPSFYIWSSNDVEICDRFLLGVCPLSGMCKMHHTPLPFHWQLYNLEAQRWVDIKPRAQVLLERMYCNVDRETVTLIEGQASFTLNLSDLEMVDIHKYESVRRLSNSDSYLRNPHFPSVWHIYWRNTIEWVEYNEELSTLLLSKMEIMEEECSFTVDSKEYKVDFTNMTQTNVATGFNREVRCRPAYRPPESLYPHLKTGVQLCPIQYPYHPNFNLDPLEDFFTWYPPVWCLALEDCHLVAVPAGTQAFLAVQKLFYESLPETKVDIVSIHQVQNLLHWDKYQRQKVHMQKQHADSEELLERHLFHGTNQEAAKGICRNNFDPRLAGTNGKLLGHGTYFATSASVSHKYTSEAPPLLLRHTFLAKVLVGKVTLGHYSFRRPPPCDSETSLYDACVDSVSDPNVFVVFDSCQCYPYYLIKYKNLNGVIEI